MNNFRSTRLLRAHNPYTFVTHFDPPSAPPISTSSNAFLSNRNFNPKIVTDSPKVTTFATQTGADPVKNPYTIHANVPAEKIRNIPREMSRADRNFSTLNSCGTNDIVVIVAAAYPIPSIAAREITMLRLPPKEIRRNHASRRHHDRPQHVATDPLCKSRSNPPSKTGKYR